MTQELVKLLRRDLCPVSVRYQAADTIETLERRIADLEARIKHLTEYHFTDAGIPPPDNNVARVDIKEPETNEGETISNAAREGK